MIIRYHKSKIASVYQKSLYFQIGNHKKKKNIRIAFYIVLFLSMHFDNFFNQKKVHTLAENFGRIFWRKNTKQIIRRTFWLPFFRWRNFLSHIHSESESQSSVRYKPELSNLLFWSSSFFSQRNLGWIRFHSSVVQPWIIL